MMNLFFIAQLSISIAFGGLIVVLIAYALLKKEMNRYDDFKKRAVKNKNQKQLLSLRLQAHERLIVFIERMNPENLLIRLHQKGIPVKDFQILISNEIRTEFQHNITQQLYIDTQTWDVIKKLKEDTLAMINSATQDLDENATSSDLSKKILQNMTNIKISPYELTVNLLKQSIHKLF